MRILFIGSRLYDDVDYYVRKKGIESILTESNEDAINFLLDEFFIYHGLDDIEKSLLYCVYVFWL